MLTTDDDELAAQFRMILNQGQDYRYHHVVLGYNYRMTELQAAIGVEQSRLGSGFSHDVGVPIAAGFIVGEALVGVGVYMSRVWIG